MNNELEQFNPTVATIKAAVLKNEGLTISGIDDEDGYQAVKVARKEMGDLRIDISKHGKKLREAALERQRWVIGKEKELLAMIEPTETKLKGELEAVDEEKKRQERAILLPARIKMLDELGIKLLDAEILRMDEVEFSAYYTEKKMAFLEEQNRIATEKENEAKRAEEIEQAKREAAENATKIAEEKAAKEKQEAEQKIINENARIAREAVRKDEDEKAEQEKIEKNRKYKEWLIDNGCTEQTKENFYISRDGNNFKMYIIVDEITI